MFKHIYMDQNKIIKNCKKLLKAYKEWKLWYMKMPEDANPWFSKIQKELCLSYFTLPMALNYQRNSYTLRESALQTYQDPQTKNVFDIQASSNMSEEDLRKKLLKYKLALQPNKHIKTRKTIATTIATNRWSIKNLLACIDNDFLKLKKIIQKDYKQGFPYLSGPKIFNYRSFILQTYWGSVLKNSEYIDIAPDTHITKWSIRLWVITEDEAKKLTKEELSQKWRDMLQWSGITPINMHSPLWFRSRNNFIFKL